MTNARVASKEFATGPSRGTRTASTLRIHMLMERQQRLEIGDRIRQLRERSPFNQPSIAERLGIGLRAYQKLEKEGTTRFERCEELADIHRGWAERDPDWAHVSATWLWDGRENLGKLPDLLEQLNQQNAQAASPDEMAQTLREIREELTALSIQVALIPAALGEILEALKPIQDDLSSVSQQAIGQ